jgi:hypothetical protein
MNAPNIFVCAPYAAANSPRETAARELPAPHSTSHHRASIELGDASTSERMDRSSEGENVDAVEVEGERTESDADTPSASPVVRECRSEAILRWKKNEEHVVIDSASVRSSTFSPTLFHHHRSALRVEHHGL